nr:MAG TPA: hypothetical protein [Caudoviricetes sp.]
MSILIIILKLLNIIKEKIIIFMYQMMMVL